MARMAKVCVMKGTSVYTDAAKSPNYTHADDGGIGEDREDVCELPTCALALKAFVVFDCNAQDIPPMTCAINNSFCEGSQDVKVDRKMQIYQTCLPCFVQVPEASIEASSRDSSIFHTCSMFLVPC